VQEQHELQGKIRDLDTKKRWLSERIFDVEDEITLMRDKLIDPLEKRKQRRMSSGRLFVIRWSAK
jgi:hypothetical protein